MKTRAKRIFSAFYWLFSLILKDLHWKIGSVCVAFVLWLVGVHVTNPVSIQSYDNIPVHAQRRDHLSAANIILLNEEIFNQRISVSIRASRSDHAFIQSARLENIHAVVNLASVDVEAARLSDAPITTFVDIEIFIDQNFISAAPRPASVLLQLDVLEHLTLPIEIETLGEPAEGFELQTPLSDRSVVRLSGARSHLERAASVTARLNIDGAEENVVDVAHLIALDGARNDITELFQLSFTVAQIEAPILPVFIVELGALTVGQTAPGYMATEINIEPNQITAVSKDGKTDINRVVIGEIDLTMASESFSEIFDLRAALDEQGLTLARGQPAFVVVNAVIERVISREFYISIEEINIIGDRPFSFISEEPIMVLARGRESAIRAMQESDVRAELDISGLGAGIHTLQVNIILPRVAAVANLVVIDISIDPQPLVFIPTEPPDWQNEEEHEDIEDVVETSGSF